MPALPTLNLLSLSSEPKTGALTPGLSGEKDQAFHTALTQRLAQTDAAAGEGLLAGFSLPVELNVAADTLLDGAVLVDQTDTAASVSRLPALELAALERSAPELLAPREVLDGPLIALPAVPGGGLPEEAPIVLAGTLPAESVDTPIMIDSANLATAQNNTAAAPPVPADSQQGLMTSVLAGSAAATPGGAHLPEVVRLQAQTPGPAIAGTASVLVATGARTTPSEMPLPGAVAAAVVSLGEKPEAAVKHAVEQGRLQQVAPGMQNAAALAAPTAAIATHVAPAPAIVSGDSFAALESVVTPPIDPASAVAHAPGSAQAREATNTAPVPMSLSRPLASPEWNQELGERIVWLAENNRQSAELQLNPRDLGPIAIRISVADDVARVAFTAQHAVTREALESAMPQLREMLQSQGLSLGEANVSADSAPGRDREAGDQQRDAATAGTSGEASSEPAAPATGQRVHDGLFDGYA